jgi:hypothetical protein
LPFHERRDERASSAFQEIALPVTRHSTILDFRWPLPNGHGVDKLPLSRASPSPCARVTKVVLTAQLVEEVAPEDAATVHEETAVDRFRGHLLVSITRKGASKPARDLLGRPLLGELARHDAPQSGMGRSPTPRGTTRAAPGVAICDARSIEAAPAIPCDFAAHCGRRTAQPATHRAERLPTGQLP